MGIALFQTRLALGMGKLGQSVHKPNIQRVRRLRWCIRFRKGRLQGSQRFEHLELPSVLSPAQLLLQRTQPERR